jgi:aerobic C4-dicarboxylate transport protein
MLAAMKIWMKYLVGALVGAALALVAPFDDQGLRGTLDFLFELSIRIGSYALLPLILFSTPVAVFELNEDKEFWRLLGKTILLLFAAVAAMALLGVGVAAALKPTRIPLVAEAASAAKPSGMREFLLALFPSSPFEALDSGRFILPSFFLAVIVGLALSHDKAVTRPVIGLCDSLSRIFYQINSFLAEFLGALLIAITARNALELRSTPSSEIFGSLLLAVGIEVAVAALVVLPAVLYFLGGKKNPFRTLYGLLAPSLAALVSGDLYFPLGSLFKHAKESLGARRRSNALTIPLAAIFGRAGTTLVASTVFIVVLSSYSSIGVSFSSILWIVVAAPLTTLLLGSSPGKGATAALMSLCALYGKGFENGYLIAAPVALPLAAMGAFLDALWAGCASLLLARKEGTAQEKETRFYI